MKPHPRPPIIRKTIKWGGAAVTVLLVVGWLWSGWWHVGWDGTRLSWGVAEGCGYGCEHRAPHPDEWGSPFLGRLRGAPKWMLTPSTNLVNADRNYILPLWIPAIGILGATCRAWQLDIRARRSERAHLCQKCGYDPTGLAPGAVCPECGGGVPQS